MLHNMDKNKEERQIKLKVDFAFKSIFGDEKHINALKYLLRTILGYSNGEFKEIHILNSELTKDYYGGKESRLDVLVKLNNGEYVNIEMQMDNVQSNEKRFLFYWSSVYNRQLKKGEPYEKLAKTISISILDYELENSDKMHSIYHIIEDETGRKLTDMLEIHTIELPKLKKEELIKKENKEFINLMRLISSEDKEEMEMLAKQKAELAEIIDVMNAMTDDDEKWYAYLSREKFLRDQINKEYYWKTEIANSEKRGFKLGIEQGLEQGLEQGKREIALNLLKQGLDISVISSATNLNPSEITNLQKQLLN